MSQRACPVCGAPVYLTAMHTDTRGVPDKTTHSCKAGDFEEEYDKGRYLTRVRPSEGTEVGILRRPERMTIRDQCRLSDIGTLICKMSRAGEDTDNRREGLLAILDERDRQIEKWGDQSGNPLFEWMSILGEEYGELCETANETSFYHSAHPERGGYENVRREAIHVAAVALAIWEATHDKEEGEQE